MLRNLEGPGCPQAPFAGKYDGAEPFLCDAPRPRNPTDRQYVAAGGIQDEFAVAHDIARHTGTAARIRSVTKAKRSFGNGCQTRIRIL